ncbi:tetratricopeptide repeat protein [Flagellimonas sp. HMM57]|uniref:tetratricopeptide repeat protein n=1 Tax=unclassified Flagellimonas TaxID=2644544 RepID=UPI0013D7221B|nr:MULTISPECIES: tetratricopeptide repeat protein [unclassified Flagellimonas]UII75819.1 tetratricopeptide repeat protein [Flagellimonas sp. HMM57]
MKKTLLFALGCLLNLYGFSQSDEKVDSILKRIDSKIPKKEKIDLYILLAEEHAYLDSAKTAMYAEKAITLAEEIDFPESIADAYYEIGWGKIQHGAPYQEAIKPFELSLKYSEESKYYSGIANAFNGMGMIHKNMGQYDMSIDFYKKALKIQQEHEIDTGLASSYTNLGLVYKLQGNYIDALDYYNKTLQIDLESGNKNYIAGSYANIGIIHKMSGNYPEALKYYFESLKVSEALGNQKYIANNYNNIGGLYHEQNDYQSALKYHLKSLSIREEINDKKGIATNYSNIGIAYSGLKDYVKAYDYQLNALELQKELGDKRGVAIAQINIGENFLAEKKYNEAIPFLKKGIDISNNIATTDISISGMNLLGECLFELKRYREAEKILKETVLKSRETGLLKETQIASENLTKTQSALGDYKAALKSYELYHVMYDTLLGKEKTKQLSQLQIQYETEKKEQEIKSLAQQASIQSLKLKQADFNKTILAVVVVLTILVGLILFLVSRQKQLKLKQKAQNIEQNLLRVQMNPHFIFNAMTSIQDYMNQGDAKQASIYLMKFSKLIRQVLDNSRNELIPLDQEINMLENYLSIQNLKREHPFAFNIELEKDLNPEEITIPPMFAQPFIENAIEHGITSIKKNATIHIHFSIQKDSLILNISDNGEGVEETMKLKQKDYISHAIKITEERIDLYRRMQKKEITFNIKNLSQGTQVIFNLPYQYI